MQLKTRDCYTYKGNTFLEYSLQLQVTKLTIYLDNNSILRCKGRIENAALSETTRNPILLPKNDPFTQLIIECIHKQNFHTGISQTLSGET